MRFSYDKRVGAAYLYLRDDTDDVGTVTSTSVAPPGADGADDRIVLDFDHAGRLVGIEFFTPEERLHPSVLAGADTQRD
jgi:uncharacterized protein YuzE